jgi:drug/metabolite transporter (DMT)-like permease
MAVCDFGRLATGATALSSLASGYSVQNLIGVLLILISGICFGAMAIFARLTYEAGASPTTVLFLRFGIASVCMLVIMFMRRLPFPRGRTLLTLVLMGGVGYVGQSLCYFTALTLASAGLVALLLYLYPAIVTILAVIILKERVSKVKGIALVFALTGTVMTIGLGGGGQPLGILLSLGGALIYSVYILVGSRIARPGMAMPFSAVIITSGAIVSAALVAVKGTAFPVTWSGWISMMAIALLCTVLAIIAFLAGLERIGPTHAATLSTIEPFVTVILASLVLGENITLMRAVGGIMILLAVVVLARSGSTDQDR